MLEPSNAVEIVLDKINPIGTERVSIFEALGRFIAEPVISRRALPPKDNSAMDGYAIIAADSETPSAKLKVKGIIAAGDDIKGFKVERGTCYRIMTGAFVPEGADAVIQHELTDNSMTEVTLNKAVKKGFCIRKKGEDMSVGDIIDRTGEKITPYHIARLVSAGVFYISVYRKPRIAVISTGDEIADPSVQDDPYKIFDSNGPMIKAFLQELGAEVSFLGIVPDNKDALKRTFSDIHGFDIVVTSAGISAGDFDFMNTIAAELGITWDFTTINQKPGMHMSFGKCGQSFIFACPGNPVSAMFCTYFYVKPALLKMSGAKQYRNIPVTAKLGEPIFKKKGRIQFDRMKLVSEKGTLIAYPFSSQDSHRIESLVSANAFGRFDNDMADNIPAGTEIETYIFNSFQVL